MRKCFLDNLPMKNKKINWKESVGYCINFTYEEIKGNFKIVEYMTKNKHPYLKILYNKKYYIINSKSIKECQLGKILNKITSKFKIEIGQTFKDDKRDITIIDREYRRNESNGQDCKYYKYHCNKCGNEDWIIEGNILKNHNCNICTNSKVIVGYNDIATTDKWMMKYLVNKEDGYKYTYGSGRKVLCKCPDCGYEKEIEINLLYSNKSMSCPICSDGISYPEKFMANLLSELNIKFKNEYSPKWIKPKRYDFYLPDYNLIIEMDGAFHYIDNNRSGQTVEKSKEIDDYKDKMAKEHNIEVVRIDCNYEHDSRFEYIKNNIIHSKLNNILELNNINWNEINLKSQESLIMKACNIKNKNPNLTTGQIGKILNKSTHTISEWLKIGNLNGLCKYNVKHESKKVIKNNSIKNSKSVLMYKNNKLIDEFKNSFEIEKISQERFNEKLYSCEINRVCNKRKDSYKGYYFEFKDKNNIIKDIKYKKGRNIEVFKDDVSFGIFESCNELSRKSKEIFGVKFQISKISLVANGKRKSHKGYTFKYVDDK